MAKEPHITFQSLSEIAPELWLRLLTDSDVARHMPLSRGGWTLEKAADWAAGKDAQWRQNGYGPWSILVEGAFAGWGGFQKEGEDADLGLVLLPQFWGYGAAIFREMIARGRGLPLGPVTILLPPSRTRLSGLKRLGFVPDGEVDYDGARFLKFRLEMTG